MSDSCYAYGLHKDDGVIDRLMYGGPPPQSVISCDVAEMLTFKLLQPHIDAFFAVEDNLTLEHSIRVAAIARAGARFMNLSPYLQDIVEVSGLMHDIGKTDPQIAPIIKSGRRLTAEERPIVNYHAQAGFERLFDAEPNIGSSLRQCLGGFMGHVALDVLYSHANARNPSQRALDSNYIRELVARKVITDDDALYHLRSTTVQLLTVADVTDALISTGHERAYRAHRLEFERGTARLGPDGVQELLEQTVEVSGIDVGAIVTFALQNQQKLNGRAAAIAKWFYAEQ